MLNICGDESQVQQAFQALFSKYFPESPIEPNLKQLMLPASISQEIRIVTDA